METLVRNTGRIGECMGVGAKDERRKQEFEGEKLVFEDFGVDDYAGPAMQARLDTCGAGVTEEKRIASC